MLYFEIWHAIVFQFMFYNSLTPSKQHCKKQHAINLFVLTFVLCDISKYHAIVFGKSLKIANAFQKTSWEGIENYDFKF